MREAAGGSARRNVTTSGPSSPPARVTDARVMTNASPGLPSGKENEICRFSAGSGVPPQPAVIATPDSKTARDKPAATATRVRVVLGATPSPPRDPLPHAIVGRSRSQRSATFAASLLKSPYTSWTALAWAPIAPSAGLRWNMGLRASMAIGMRLR